MRKLLLVLLLLPLFPALAQEETAPLPRPRPPEAQRPAEAKPPARTGAAWLPETALKPAAGTPTAANAPEDATPPVPAPRLDPRKGKAAGTAETVTADEPAETSDGRAADAATEEGTPETPATPPKEPRVYQTACPAVLLGQVEAKSIPPISDGQCGTQSPLEVTGVLTNGRMVPLSGPITTSCGMATVLPTWLSAVDSYLKGHDNTEVESLVVGTSYMCRNVNNAKTGNLSDHAFADALDVVGFKLKDGRTITILEGWPGSKEQGSSIVRYAHDAACSSFMTVLGPEANALHHDHLHLDLLCHGKSCTARLCE